MAVEPDPLDGVAVRIVVVEVLDRADWPDGQRFRSRRAAADLLDALRVAIRRRIAHLAPSTASPASAASATT
ncbi:MAG: hypothetical protein AAB284_07170, partial [Chloroflexota bacterium]